jgi:hypothetical protein
VIDQRTQLVSIDLHWNSLPEAHIEQLHPDGDVNNGDENVRRIEDDQTRYSHTVGTHVGTIELVIDILKHCRVKRPAGRQLKDDHSSARHHRHPRWNTAQPVGRACRGFAGYLRRLAEALVGEIKGDNRPDLGGEDRQD